MIDADILKGMKNNQPQPPVPLSSNEEGVPEKLVPSINQAMEYIENFVGEYETVSDSTSQ